MVVRPSNSWAEVGEKVSRGRLAANLTQQQLADAAGIERTAVSRIESGQRGIDALELARIAEALKRPFAWFLESPPRALLSRRTQSRSRLASALDLSLEDAARDTELVLSLGRLDLEVLRLERPLTDVQSAESAARTVRQKLQVPRDPLWDLGRHAEKLGLMAFSLTEPAPEETRNDAADRTFGAYVALDSAGVAVVDGLQESGRRRFTLAHEIGHHVLGDEYSADWDASAGLEQRERLIDAFAIHLLMPREGIVSRWQQLGGYSDPRSALLVLGAEFGVSWSAACSHLVNLEFLGAPDLDRLKLARPRRAEYLERDIVVREDLRPPEVPQRYAAAVIGAYRRHAISQARALDLLRGTLKASDLPDPNQVPQGAFAEEFDPL